VDLGHFDLVSAEECDLVENPVRAIPVDGNRLHLHVGKFAYSTIRLLGRAQPPQAVEMVKARAASDSEMALEWPAVAGAAGYNVFRSEDPKDPPTVYTLAGRAVGNHFADIGLNLDTTYYYHVASVSRDNRQSEPSKQASAHTSAVNRTAPGTLEDLGIVRQSKDTLVVYWRKAVEPDIARYLVYRSQTKSFPASAQPIADVKPTQFFLQLYRDTGLEPGHTYYYKVLAEDWAGNRQKLSGIATSATPQ
jgi:fibronectin type 3 domain-containing protein